MYSLGVIVGGDQSPAYIVVCKLVTPCDKNSVFYRWVLYWLAAHFYYLAEKKASTYLVTLPRHSWLEVSMASVCKVYGGGKLGWS